MPLQAPKTTAEVSGIAKKIALELDELQPHDHQAVLTIASTLFQHRGHAMQLEAQLAQVEQGKAQLAHAEKARAQHEADRIFVAQRKREVVEIDKAEAQPN